VNTSRLLMIVFLGLLAAGCSPMLDVSSNYDFDADFTAYKTYDLMKPEELQLSPSASAEFAGRRHVMEAELVKALNANMQALGFKRDADNPDIMVAYYVGVRDEVFTANYGFDYNDITGAAAVQNVQDGSVRIDFVDPKTKQVVWTGEGHGAVNRDPTEDMIRTNVNRAVEKILKQYPPKKSPY
jgi:hypothetical protein